MTIPAATRYARQIATGPYGYSQGTGRRDGRWSGLDYTPGNFDCSAALGAIWAKGGFLRRSQLAGTWYSGNIINRAVASGMFYAIKVAGKSLTELRALLREGDGLRGPGHVVYCVGGGQVVSFEADERGRQTGGKPGDQTGREGRIRALYTRPKGWTHIIRPYPPEVFLGRVLARYGAGKSTTADLDRLIMRAPWDGPRWKWFLDQWEKLDRGMIMADVARDLTIPKTGHVFVVLGSGLKSDGGMPVKFRRRLQLALDALNTNPGSKVLVTGGAPKSGITEAAAGRTWLLDHGIDTSRILIETRAASTIGNAKHSTPILAGFTTATLISDASHIRRAQIEFYAAQVQAETVVNQVRDITWTPPLVFNDYSPGPVKTERPVTAATRRAIAAEVATLLGISAHYKTAL